MKRGNIIFVQGTGLISRIIRLVDNGDFSHCSFAVSDSKVIEAEYNTRVAARDFVKSDYSLIEVVDLGLTRSETMEAYNSAVSYLGRKYDHPSLAWYLLRKLLKLKGSNKLNNPYNLICSELIFLILDDIGYLDGMGIENGGWEGIDLTPNELYDLVKYVSTKKGS